MNYLDDMDIDNLPNRPDLKMSNEEYASHRKKLAAFADESVGRAIALAGEEKSKLHDLNHMIASLLEKYGEVRLPGTY